MALELKQTATAVGPRVPASFQGSGGAEPYSYEVIAGGAGGTIDASTGIYTAPSNYSSDPKKRFDTVQVTDSAAETAETTILVGSPLMLLCNIIQTVLELPAGRVYLWDQKIMQPTDSGLYVAVSMPAAKPFGSSNRFNGDTNQSEQYVAMQGMVDIDLISRDSSARDRKEELILALDSDYSRFQQDANSFSVGKITKRFINISDVDGAAIPYRFKASVNMQYSFSKNTDVSYFDEFTEVELTTND